jgi:pimeloyl-ACP methyl ester carboxylesterase
MVNYNEFARKALERRGARGRLLDVAGHRTHVVEAGDGPVTVLWFPALGDDAVAFGAVLVSLAERLAGVGRVMAVDPPGYGSSTLPPDALMPTFGELSSWTEDLVQQTTGPLISMGNSSGGVLATVAAEAAGERAAGLILTAWADWKGADPPGHEEICPIDKDAVERLLRRSWHNPPALKPRLIAAHINRFSAPGFLRHAASFDRADFVKRFERYPGRVAFVGGLSDGLVPPPAIEASVAGRPGAEVRWIERSGHYPHKEQPVQLTQALEDLVRWCISP